MEAFETVVDDKMRNTEFATQTQKKVNIWSNGHRVAGQILLWHSAFTCGIQQIYTPKNTEIEQAKADNSWLEDGWLVIRAGIA